MPTYDRSYAFAATAGAESFSTPVELPRIVQADGGLRFGRYRREHSVCHLPAPTAGMLRMPEKH